MKIFNPKLYLILFLISISGCGMLNNVYTTHYNIVKDFTPHGYKVKRGGVNGFPENGMGVVSLNVVTEQDNENNNVDTLWRKINDDGTFSGRISLTYINPFKDGRRESMLEPGTYFLDGFRFSTSKAHIRVGAFQELIAINTQKGWDINRKQPLWFSFTIEKGKEINIPDIHLSGRCLSGLKECDGVNFAVSIKIDELDSKKSQKYQIGYKVEQ